MAKKKGVNVIVPKTNSFIDLAYQYAYISVGQWIYFDGTKETSPKEYGKYLVCRKDGKIHFEVWNNTKWAYNHNEIRFWADIINPLTRFDNTIIIDL